MRDENYVIRPNEDIFGGIVNHAGQQNPDAPPVPLQRYVTFDRFELRATGARDQRQQPFADAVEGQDTWRIDVTQNADDARVLLIKADDHLRLDRAVPQPGNNRLLYLWNRSRSSGNLSSVGNINGSLLVNGLRRQIDEVTGTSARSLSRCE